MIHPHDLYSPSEPWTIRIKNIAREFIKKGHSVKLIYFPLDKKQANKITLDGEIQIISLDRRLGALVLLCNIIRVIKLAEWSDVIHFQKCYYYVALPALIAAFVRNKPLHYDWDDWETQIFYYSNPKQYIVGEFLNVLEKLIPQIIDTVSVSSRRIRELCLSRGVIEENIFSAHVGANLEKFRPDLAHRGAIKRKYSINNYLILYIGQLHGGQYTELFIKSAKVIIEKRQDVNFMVVGDGYRSKELQGLVMSLGLDKYFIFSGSVNHDEIPYYINDADVCIACFEKNNITLSKSPLKIVEYLACGKPIVASNVGEVRNMVGGLGILADPGDIYSLAKGIMLLLDDKALRENCGRLARLRAQQRYNWSVTAENILCAYRKSA